MKSGLVILATAFLVQTASAQSPQPATAPSPECVDPTEANPVFILDGTNRLHFCAPQVDQAGDILLEDEITFCRIVVDGVVWFQKDGVRPGEYVNVPTGIQNGPKLRQVFAYCTGPEGQGEVGPTYTTRFRRGKPSRAWMLW